MMTETISLFDLGTLGLMLAWTLCWIDHFAHKRTARHVSCGVVGTSSLLMLVAVVWRGVAAGHMPLTSAYEFSLVFILAISVAYCVLSCQAGHSLLGICTLPIPLLLAAYARWGIPHSQQLTQPIAPALRSYWLPIHAITAALAYGFFSVACGAALWWIAVRQSDSRQVAARTMIKAVQIGYLWLTASMVSGVIWAHLAWGRYWRWDPKEIWTLLTWLIYTLFLHARYRRSWTGRPLALLALLGFLVLMFTFLGVSPLARWISVESLHVF